MSSVSRHGDAGSARGKEQGCSICAAQSRAVFDVLVQWQFRLVRSQSERAAFASARGFCSFHMWLLKQVGDPLSLSRAWAPLVDAWADELQQLMDGPIDQANVRITSALPRSESCSVCHVELCLRHVVAALGASSVPEVAYFLLSDCLRRMESISRDLHNYAAKRDGEGRDLLTEYEQDAWQRALVLLAGARTVRDAKPE